MKTIAPYFPLLVICLLIFSCTKDSLLLKTDTKIEDRNLEVFDFDINKAICINDGCTYTIVIDEPENYSFIWKVDLVHRGKTSTLNCACGSSAHVHVQRLSDSLQICKYITLSPCKQDLSPW